MARCNHPEVLRYYDFDKGINVSEGQPRKWKCQKCGKTSVDIQDFKPYSKGG